MKDIRCFCDKCKRDYELAGHTFRLIRQSCKDKCIICDRPGWTYSMDEKEPEHQKERIYHA